MESIVDTFYSEVIPGLLTGNITCGINIRVISNVLFKEKHKLLKAKPPVKNLYIPTLVINNKQLLDSRIIEYVSLMTNIGFLGKDYIDKDETNSYIIASAIANMEEKDYKNPERYFERLIYIHKNNPISELNESTNYIDTLKGSLSMSVKNESLTQECPFVFKASLESDIGLYKFPIIRFYIIDNVAYIGAIQNMQSIKDDIINKTIRRRLYKVNKGVTKEDFLSVDPAAVCSLNCFISLLQKHNIDTIKLIPYNPQRSNDKELHIYALRKLFNIPDLPYKAKVVDIFRKKDLYYDRLPKFQNQLKTAILRINNHYPNTEITNEGDYPSIIINNLEECTNPLLEEINTAINNKKTRH